MCALRKHCGRALRHLPDTGHEVQPGKGKLPQRRLRHHPWVEEEGNLAAVDHVVEGAPGRVAPVNVLYVREPVSPAT